MEIVAKNPVNEATPKNLVSSSFFPQPYHHFTTMRFGEYQPHVVFEGVAKDHLIFRSRHDVRSYTLKAPLMGDIKIKKDYFVIPMECILPKNWDKVYTNPIVGDDVNAFRVGCTVQNFPDLLKKIINSFKTYITYNPSEEEEPEPLTDEVTLERQFMYMLTSERFCSAGSLLHNLGYKLSGVVLFGTSDSDRTEFDTAFDKWIAALITNVKSFQIYFGGESNLSTVVLDGSYGSKIFDDPRTYTLHDALCKMRDESFSIDSITYNTGITDLPTCPTNLDFASCTGTGKGYPLNLGSLYAYQMVCSHFYSNDHVDYIYSAELYRQNLQGLIDDFGEYFFTDNISYQTFNYNGVSCQFDITSAEIFTTIVHFINGYFDEQSVGSLKVAYDILRLIFGLNRSLRYMDYFTGARTWPLAVGDVGAAVADSKVSAIDMTRSIQMQRFLNAVNRGHRKYEEYIKNLFPGAHPREDMHNPHWIGHTDDIIYGSEVDNTGADQLTQANSVTSTLRGNADRFAFEIDLDRPCFILGITYFDIERAYWKSIDRMFFHSDRFSMFNPMMQFIGDQPIIRAEIDSRNAGNANFAYTLRYMEYKQRFNTASGGFATKALPSWAFLADSDTRNGDTNNLVISPDYIRSRPAELDKFYVSLAGYSLANYFHFLIDNSLDVKANRDMVYAPSIL